jgi:redox-sensitive bicupin YhaK (pirin superfamily)
MKTMSGQVDPPAQERLDQAGIDTIQVREGRTTQIGELAIMRILPTKRRRTVGPWCFVDLMSPGDVERPPPMEIGPHPHIGLATVTWLFAGSALHSDSLGTEQLIRPGELNLMTAGHGIAHAELGVDTSRALETSGIMGAQMWIAQTEQTRHGASEFEHLDDLPVVDLGTGEAHLLIGEHGGESSPARVDRPAVGLDVTMRSATELGTDPTFEYGVVPIDRPVGVEEALVEPGSIAMIPPGRDALHLQTRTGPGRLLVLGGRPFGERLTMWWNFVARSRDEITGAWLDWQAHNEDRFAPVPSSLDRMDTPPPPWLRSEHLD